MTVMTDALPFYDSVTIGVWVRSGSRMESSGEEGLAHFTEHMLFKGTDKRSARDIVLEPESLGAHINAYTMREITCYYIQTPAAGAEKAVEILADMLTGSVFHPRDVETERQVILEEITATEDTPEDYVVDLFQEKLFPEHPLGHPILGTRETVGDFSPEDVRQFWRQWYRPDRLLIAAAGYVTHDAFTDWCEKYFQFTNDVPSRSFSDQKPNARKGKCPPVSVGFSQRHICCGTALCAANAPDRYPLELWHTLLGAGMSSLLFQQLRETHGMVYTVYSYPEFYSDSGVFFVYLGVDPRKETRALELLKNTLNSLARDGIDRDTLERVKRQYNGQRELSMESTYKRMAHMARQFMETGRVASLSELSAGVDAVDVEQMMETAQRYLNFDNWLMVTLQ